MFSVEYLPGQFDQRADSAVQCVKFLNEEENPIIRTATTYLITGSLTDEEFEQIKSYCINPVDSRETGMVKPDTLETVYEEPADVKVLDGFAHLPEAELKALYDSLEKRQEEGAWDRLFSDPAFLDLEEEENCRKKLFVWLMSHSYLPTQIWKTLDRHLSIAADREKLLEEYPSDFVGYLVRQVREREAFSF